MSRNHSFPGEVSKTVVKVLCVWFGAFIVVAMLFG